MSSLEILEQDDYNLVFVLEGISIEMVNAIRRIMLTEIPVMAIDEVIILKNDSPLYDEIVSHRLGMIPLKTDLDAYRLPSECECDGFGCPLCQVSLTCEIQNTSNSPITVFSGDLKSNDPVIVPVSPDIPILKIDKNNSVIIEAYAKLGHAREHMKWQAVSNVHFRLYPKVDFDDSKCAKCQDKCVVSRLCPKNLYDFSDKKTPKLEKDYWKTCDLCNACRDACPEKAIKLGKIKDKYIFVVESDGVLPFDIVIKKTFEIFNEKIREFEEKLEEVEIQEP
ncbi:MAG: DNA-directed RNA polymerase subunit D [Candidatus Lokiarchaeota archaeon]|nr:DNA-directed RNA polymerase subunit D [Candidatus Lokiarchaeota archaeon]